MSEHGGCIFEKSIEKSDSVSADKQTMTSKAGLFDKIIAFFKNLFGLTKTIPQVFESIY